MSSINGHVIIQLIICFIIKPCFSTAFGPIFRRNPPNDAYFSNDTGTIISCLIEGNPKPEIKWVHGSDNSVVENIPGLRYAQPDGTLIFSSFSGHDFRHEIHHSTYKCIGSNKFGSIISRNVHVKTGK